MVSKAKKILYAEMELKSQLFLIALCKTYCYLVVVLGGQLLKKIRTRLNNITFWNWNTIEKDQLQSFYVSYFSGNWERSKRLKNMKNYS